MNETPLDVRSAKAVLEAADHALAWVDSKGDVAAASASFQAIAGAGDVRALTRVLKTWLGEGWVARAPFAAQQILAGGHGLSLSARPLPGGDLLLSLHDGQALQDVECLRDEALGFLSHDLRSPLAAIISLSEAQLDGSLPPSEDMLDRVTRQARLALEQADGVLRLLRASALRPERFEPVDLVRVAHEAAEECWSPSRARGVRVVVDESRVANQECLVMGEIDLLRRATTNLLLNAIEHGPSDAEVRLILQPEPPTGWRLAICDAGRPLDEAERRRIIGRPHRHEGRLRRAGGLGLALARTVSERHGGRLSAEDCVGGNAFVLHLPQYRETAG
ncbi:HAMP domain-containing sensor histidine kinase [Niveibacterium sp. SC-1]|uniref:sensor histidine kinase n=1 Tax=Niveibacterium sp. SC-1 TaxID=3135646 RepID=UPI0031201F98